MDDWEVISAAPYGVPLALAVIEKGEIYALVFPCLRTKYGWVRADTQASVEVHPTHWREWSS